MNAVITTRCTKPVTRIAGTMSLYRNGSFVGNGDGSTTGSPDMDMNAATPCFSGAYHSFGGVSVTFPPGYEPPFDDTWVTSPTVPISCNTTNKYWVDTFANVPQQLAGGARTGTLYAGTNDVYGKVRARKVQVGGDYNHWWLLTDLMLAARGATSSCRVSTSPGGQRRRQGQPPEGCARARRAEPAPRAQSSRAAPATPGQTAPRC